MTVRNLLTVNAIYVAIIALASLLAPTAFLEANGFEVSDTAVSLQRAVGAVIVGYAIMSWILRDVAASPGRRAFMLGAGIGYFVVAIVFFVDLVAGQGNAMAWVYIVLNILFGGAFIYMEQMRATA